MFEVASAAVEAALAAGARYADARAMHQRNESMSARNGDVEDLSQRESVGVGVEDECAGVHRQAGNAFPPGWIPGVAARSLRSGGPPGA